MAKRRSNGEGSIRQRTNGTWQASVMIGYHADGRRRMKYFTGKTQKEAKAKLTAYLNDKASGLRVDEDYTLSEWCKMFMDFHKQNIKPVTYENYKYMLRIIDEHLGHMHLQQIKPMVVENFLHTLAEEGRSDSAISKTRALLHMALERAEANDLIRRNPVPLSQKMRQQQAKKQPCFTEEEMRILMRELPNDRIGNSIRLLLGSGLRTQELLGLMPKHIKEDGSQIVIEQAVTMVRGTATISTPKSHTSYRIVPIPEIIRHCAIALRNTDADFIWSVGNPHKPANPSTFRTAYRKAIEAIPEVTYRPPHSCRRAYVSLLQSQHVDMATVQSLVGHSSLGMTQHYLTVHPSIQLEAAAKFSEAFLHENSSASDK
ncbi:MAG: tyrosine-type recombinase/integrase family protein [Bacteroidaceae bacterium]|nr:tyrosine-type recombinase/integrase family protein [Bacteroidaceae bacterium]